MLRSLPLLGILILTLICLLQPHVSHASTLDPSHRVWSETHASRAWAEALLELRTDQANVSKPKAEIRERAVAHGRRVLVIPVLPSGAVPTRTWEDLRAAWSGDSENSVRGYWQHVSAGALDLEIRVLPWLTVPGTLGANYLNVLDGRPTASITAGPRNLARDGLAAAAKLVDDLAVFDDDGPDRVAGSGDDDGVLDLVVLLHPYEPWEISAVAEGAAIVSLQSRLRGEVIAGSSNRLDAFVVSSATSPLGVWVHEFGHLLGLPDLYDTDRNTNGSTPGAPDPLGGVGRWSLMASGTWGGEGSLPSGLDPWSRRRLGYDQTSFLNGRTSVMLSPVTGLRATSLELQPMGNWGTERFLLERRERRIGGVVDGALPGSGVIVYRVTGSPHSNHSTLGRWIEVIQADGNDDIGAGENDGDATDVYDGLAGRDELSATTIPSSVSRDPDPSRIAPRMTLSVAHPDGWQFVTIALSDGPTVRLRRADIQDGPRGDRLHLLPGEASEWRLEFADNGEVAASTVRVRVRIDTTVRNATVAPAGWVDCTLSGGVWRPSPAVELTDFGGTEDYLAITLDVEVDSAPFRSIEIGLPVGQVDGLAPGEFSSFTQEIFAAPNDTTVFERLTIEDLPLPASIGYRLVTQGAPGYSSSVELALTSPWAALAEFQDLSLWSKSDTEDGFAGQAFDGGVLELFIPDEGWRVLKPDGIGMSYIVRQSEAATRDNYGFGGEGQDWAPFHFELPELLVPSRLRLRFASDGSLEGEGWSVAGLHSRQRAPSADMEVRVGVGDAVSVLIQMKGDTDGLATLRVRYREIGSEVWLAASGVFFPLPDSPTSIPLLIPTEVKRAEIGLFAEVAASGSGSTPPLLLGRAGMVRLGSPSSPRVRINPAIGTLILTTAIVDEARVIDVFDLRGRRVAEINVPAGSDWVEWDGRGSGSDTLASGRYFLRWADRSGAVVSFLWLR